MAITFQRLTVLSRSSGRSAVAATAYVMRASLRDDRTGTLHTYTRARDVDPEGCGVVGWAGDAGSLANAMEQAEARKDARTARLVVVALPAELDPTEQRDLLRAYTEQLAAIAGTPAVYARHDKGDGNPHGHVILATRSSSDGLALDPKKARIWDDKKTGPETCSTARQAWIDFANAALVRAGHAPGLTFSAEPDTLPQRHLGPVRAGLEAKGQRTDAGDYNRAVQARNAAAAALRAAQEVEAAALVVPPPLPTPAPPLAPVRKATEQPATALRPTASAVAVRGSGTAPERPGPDVSGWWPVVLGTAPGLRDPADRAAWLAPRVEVQAQQHTAEAIQRALWQEAPNNRRGAWLSLRGVAERAKSLTKRTTDWWDRLTKPPIDLVVDPRRQPHPKIRHMHNQNDPRF